MACLTKIKHAYKALNRSQVGIADYILKHPYEVLSMNVQELAEQTDTSASTIVRFAKKIGYTGYPQLKLDLAIDVSKENEEYQDGVPALDGSFLDFINQEKKSYLNTTKMTFNLLNTNTLEKVVDLIKSSKNIYLSGLGASSLVCRDLAMKLSRIGFCALYYSDSHTQIVNANNLRPDDVVIAISYKGLTKEVTEVSKIAKANGSKIIAITQNNGSELSYLCDYCLPVPDEVSSLRALSITSRNASNIICDLIYLGIIKKEGEVAQSRLQKTDEIANTKIYL